jgi:hypothetical protein
METKAATATNPPTPSVAAMRVPVRAASEIVRLSAMRS